MRCTEHFRCLAVRYQHLAIIMPCCTEVWISFFKYTSCITFFPAIQQPAWQSIWLLDVSFWPLRGSDHVSSLFVSLHWKLRAWSPNKPVKSCHCKLMVNSLSFCRGKKERKKKKKRAQLYTSSVHSVFRAQGDKWQSPSLLLVEACNQRYHPCI